MKAAISGSGGFIGKHLSTALSQKKIEVVPITRELLYSPKDLNEFFHKEKPDYIFHLAAYGNMAHQTDIAMIVMANIFGTFNMLKESQDIPYKAFINISSSAVTLDHQTLYSASKHGAEDLCEAFVDEYNKPIVTIRPYSIYGPEDTNQHFIPTVFRSCLEDELIEVEPRAVHDWVYIDDLIDQILKIAEAVEMSELFDTQEIGTGHGYTNLEVVQLIEEITKQKANYTIVKKMRSFDNPNWVSEGWPYLIGFREGLQKYYEWYKKQL